MLTAEQLMHIKYKYIDRFFNCGFQDYFCWADITYNRALEKICNTKPLIKIYKKMDILY